jgi:hypothetical protein
MAVISFSKNHERSWVMAGWVVRQILDDVIAQYPNDSDMASEFDYAKQSSGICVESLEPDLRIRVTNTIRQTVTGILSGKIKSGINDGRPFEDAKIVEKYHGALKELLDLIPPD